MTTPATAQRGTKRAHPRDHTGRQIEQAQAAVAEELEERATELSLAREAEATRRETEVVDYTKGGHKGPSQAQPSPVSVMSPELAAEIAEQAVEVGPQEVTIRVNSKIEDMVYGRQVVSEAFVDEGGTFHPAVHGNLQFYSFVEGQRYKVPVDLAMHLEALGYLYH
jgi:hypothetical protein